LLVAGGRVPVKFLLARARAAAAPPACGAAPARAGVCMLHPCRRVRGGAGKTRQCAVSREAGRSRAPRGLQTASAGARRAVGSVWRTPRGRNVSPRVSRHHGCVGLWVWTRRDVGRRCLLICGAGDGAGGTAAAAPAGPLQTALANIGDRLRARPRGGAGGAGDKCTTGERGIADSRGAARRAGVHNGCCGGRNPANGAGACAASRRQARLLPVRWRVGSCLAAGG
jgi:hypothetical protein